MRCGTELINGCGALIAEDEHQLVQSIKPSTAPICYDCFKTHIISLCESCGANVYGADHALYRRGHITKAPCSRCFRKSYIARCPNHSKVVHGDDIIRRIKRYGVFYDKCNDCYNREFVFKCKCGMPVQGRELDRIYNKTLLARCGRCALRRWIE